MEDYITTEAITKYIRSLIPDRQGIFKAMEDYALENNVPIAHPEVAKLIALLAHTIKPHKILEVGSAIGYSAIHLAGALAEGGRLVTIEKNEIMAAEARANIAKAGLSESITVLEGDAKEILPTMDDRFDIIFLDAAKGQYPDFFNHCMRMLNGGGLLIADNVLYKGMIADNSLVIRRKITIVKRLRRFLQVISTHPQLTTSVIPIGDGVAVAIKQADR